MKTYKEFLTEAPMTYNQALDTLGLDSGYSEDDLKKAYKDLSKKLHPDLGGDVEKMKDVNRARDILVKSDGGFPRFPTYKAPKKRTPEELKKEKDDISKEIYPLYVQISAKIIEEMKLKFGSEQVKYKSSWMDDGDYAEAGAFDVYGKWYDELGNIILYQISVWVSVDAEQHGLTDEEKAEASLEVYYYKIIDKKVLKKELVGSIRENALGKIKDVAWMVNRLNNIRL